MSQTKIKCPKCSTEIDVNSLLYENIKNQIEAEHLQAFKQREEQIALEKQKIEETKKQLNDKFLERVESEKQRIKLEIEAQNKKNLDEANKMSQDLMEESYKLKAVLAQQKAELNAQEAIIRTKLIGEMEERKNSELQLFKQEIERKNSELILQKEEKLIQMQKKLEDQVRLTEEMRKKQEQGSMQLQGETQELMLEEFLKSTYPLDDIEEIKKGARGADCLQRINTREYLNCGTIYYESKNTATFSNEWIEKFRQDIKSKNANVGILVTKVMPKGDERSSFILKDDVWICQMNVVGELSNILRHYIIEMYRYGQNNMLKDEKMNQMHGFLTSNEFKIQMEQIIQGFVKLKSEIDREKAMFAKIWKEREKQLELIIHGTSELYGSFKGILGSQLKAIDYLEMPEELDHSDI
ncbi:MAG: DUF2130 domain-containing protein [Chitinophagales bacterium]|nr:DUF2130 domain-containing protein [Chitinophagales bacterium]